MILIKEEFVGGEKYRRAAKLGGSDAIVLWLALKCYASEHPSTEGFVPDEDLDQLAGAPRNPRKALQALLDCGGLLRDGQRGAGLVERVQGGWQLHDYLDHSVPPEELELRREKARIKKQRQREDKRRELAMLRGQSPPVSRGQEGDSVGQVPGDVPRDRLAGAGARGPAPVRVGARPQPSPPQPNFKTPEISEPRARTREPASIGFLLGSAEPRCTRVVPHAEHRRFAAEHALDLEAILARVNADPRTQALPPADALKSLSKALSDAAAGRERLGGAA